MGRTGTALASAWQEGHLNLSQALGALPCFPPPLQPTPENWGTYGFCCPSFGLQGLQGS